MTWTKKIRIEQIETGSLSGSYFVQGGNSFGTTATLGTNDNQSLAFETNGTTKMFISSSGNVGIGTTNPATKLDIFNQATFNTTTPGLGNYGLHFSGQTTADFANGITWNGGTGTSGSQAGIYVQGSGFYGTKMYFATTDDYNTGAKTRMYIGHDGRVGIGTTNPTASLHISGSTTQNIFRAGNSTNPRLLDITGSNVNQIGGNFIVNNSSTQINSSANIGLQVTPEAWVHIYTDPENSKFLRIDAEQISSNPPTSAGTPGTIIGQKEITEGKLIVLGEPDFWMEIELNGNGNIVLIPCYTPEIL
jgi:hypothetical protein